MLKQGKITVRVDSTLNKYMIDNNRNRELACICPIKLKDVFMQLGIDSKDIGLVVRNNSILSLEADLYNNDIIMIFPFLEGG